MTTREPLTQAALATAARGWHVFPLRPGGKRPALHPADRCPGTGACSQGHRTWEQRATTDEDRIRAAWARAPYNVGIATGPAGLVVLDLDTLKPDEPIPERWQAEGIRGGEDVLAVLADEAGAELPADTLTVATPSGGLHLYYQAPQDFELRNTHGDTGRGLGWKVDTRAVGGYVVAPGSVVDGHPYRVLAPADPAPLPAWLAERLTPEPLPPAPVSPIRTGRRSRYLDAAIREECRRVTTARTNRNAALYAASVALGQLVAGGALAEDDAKAELLTAAGRHIGVRQFSHREAIKTIASGLTAGANRPRQIA